MNVEDALAEIYSAFAHELRPARLEASPYVSDKERLQRLVSAPLRQLLPDDVGWYGFKAMTTIGTEQDFMYFLPAVLETAISTPWPDLEIVYEKARQCPLSPKQYDALSQLLFVWWAELLHSPDGWTFRLQEVLTAAARFGVDWQPFLRIWEEDAGFAPVLQLAHFINYVEIDPEKPNKFNVFLGQNGVSQLQKLKSWIERRKTVERLETAFFITEDEAARKVLSEAHSRVSWLDL